VRDIEERVRTRTGDDVPERLAHADSARAYFGLLREVLESRLSESIDTRDLLADIALGIQDIVSTRTVVNWTNNIDVQNKMRTAIEDLLFNEQERAGFELTFDEIDGILDRCISTSKALARSDAR
jgi:type I restriction enzyme R subunit